jgi:hypothetical protein
LKLVGLGKASKKHADALWRAQILARWLGYGGRTLTIDDVRDEIERNGWELELGNSAGNVFDRDNWELVFWERSRRDVRHAGLIGRWRIKNGN